MAVRAEHITGQAIVEEARRWIGRPFRHQGRSEYGVDCIGLVILVRHTLAPWPRAIRRAPDYRRNPNGQLLLELPEHLEPIVKPEPGCVAVITWPRQKHPSHVAILTPETIIHAYAAAGRVVETSYAGHWLRQTHSLWRLPGVEP